MNLNNFFNKYGIDTTTNFDLIKYAKELKIKPFYYTMRDEIINLPDNCYVITNINTSKEKGVHHSALVKNQNKYFFDSYGLPPTEEIGEGGKYSTFQLQNFNQKYCGQLSLYFLYKFKFQPKKSFEEIVLDIKMEIDNLNK